MSNNSEIDNKLVNEYFESSVISSEDFKAVLNATSSLLVNEPVTSPVALSRTDLNNRIKDEIEFPCYILAVPICSDFIVYGYAVVFYFEDAEYCVIDDPQVVFLARAMRMASLVLERDHKEAMTSHYLINDYLTDLPNRSYIYEMIIYSLQSSELYETRFALMIVRVNGLKNINNSLGIFTGDTLLKEMGALVKSAAASSASVTNLNPFVGRLSGGDFVVLLTFNDLKEDSITVRQSDEEIINIFCEAIIDKAKDYIEIYGYKIFLSVNIGISIYPHHGATAEEMLRKADLAKGFAKQSKPNSYKIYDNHMDGDLERIMFLNNNLPIAISSNQFELFYQGQMDIKTKKIVGAEALIRWRHPEKGLIFPGYFISYAEENGYGIQIDTLVLDMACKQINKWRDMGYNISVSVNISPQHFINGLIYDTISKVISNNCTEPTMLKIEMLESVLLQNFDVTIKMINDLQKLGVAVALDDFGTGYSSLEYVAKLPLDFLKIDRGFSMTLAENSSNKIILETIMTLAKGMKVKTIIEGVENQFQFDFMKKIDCDQVQGYFINKPMPVHEFEQLLT
ncbi:MAG: bifunctional diguanylate cyclase/phosphodiesterase [Defluviitaleaceae bacterium]|nr:bifunctional diguanylate cyclase/phosphodiesterase [Defluviitaleaceae bacterium]